MHAHPSPSPLKRPRPLCHREANNASVLIVSRRAEHTGRDAPHRYRAVPILHLVEHVIVLGAFRHRVLAPLLVPRRRRRVLGWLDRAHIAGLGYNRRTTAAVPSPRVRCVVRLGARVVVVVRARLVRPVGSVRSVRRLADSRTCLLPELFCPAAMLAAVRATRGASLTNAITRYDRLVVVFTGCFNVQVVNEITVS